MKSTLVGIALIGMAILGTVVFQSSDFGQSGNSSQVKAELKKSMSEGYPMPKRDAFVMSFIGSDSLPRQKKMEIIVELLNEDLSEFGFQYLSEILWGLNPYEVSKKIITMAKATSIPYKKIALFKVLGSSFDIFEKPIDFSTDYTFENNRNTAKKFLLETLRSDVDDQVFRGAFDNYLELAENKEEIQILKEFYPTSRGERYSRKRITNLLLVSVFMGEGFKENLFLEVLSDEYEKDEDFQNTVAFWSSKTSFTITPAVKKSVIKSSELYIDSITDLRLGSSGTEMSDFIHHVKTIVKLTNADGISQATPLVDYSIKKFVTGEKSAVKISTVLMLAGADAMKLFKQRKEEIIPLLKDSLQSSEIPENIKDLLAEGIRVLNV